MGLAFVASACGGGSDSVVDPPGPAPASATVTLSADRFMPDSTTIRVGGTVAFVNPSGVVHDVDFGTPAFHIAAFAVAHLSYGGNAPLFLQPSRRNGGDARR